jgi:hypothetical protein
MRALHDLRLPPKLFSALQVARKEKIDACAEFLQHLRPFLQPLPQGVEGEWCYEKAEGSIGNRL